MSTQNARGRRDDARYGSGVYLTKIPPTTSKYEIAFNNYDGKNLQAILRILDSRKSSYSGVHFQTWRTKFAI